MFPREPRFDIPPRLLARAAAHVAARTAVAGAAHPVALASARAAAERGLIEPVLVGEPAAIRAAADEIGWRLDGVEIVPAEGDEAIATRAVALARAGEVSILMKGHVQTNALMAAVVARDVGLRTGRRITHAFHLTVPGDECGLVISDAAINVAPPVGTKVDITLNAVRLMHGLGVACPKVAVLSGTEKATPKMPSSMEAAEVAERVAETLGGDVSIQGPLAMDVAISAHAAETKGLVNPVCGSPDVLIVPNLEAGNILYKTLVYAFSATAAGIVMGARVPIVLTSRADPPEARVTALAIARLVAE